MREAKDEEIRCLREECSQHNLELNCEAPMEEEEAQLATWSTTAGRISPLRYRRESQELALEESSLASQVVFQKEKVRKLEHLARAWDRVSCDDNLLTTVACFKAIVELRSTLAAQEREISWEQSSTKNRGKVS